MKNPHLSKDEQYELDKAVELMEDPFAFEHYCCNCDHFPGDGLYEKREYYGVCPFKQKFLEGKLNGDTNWKQIGCTEFWD